MKKNCSVATPIWLKGGHSFMRHKLQGLKLALEGEAGIPLRKKKNWFGAVRGFPRAEKGKRAEVKIAHVTIKRKPRGL